MKTNLTYLFSLVLLTSFVWGCKKNDDTPTRIGVNFYIDAINGNDTLGNGRQNQPFRSFSRAMDSLQSGDVLYLNNGNYGDIVTGRTAGLNWDFDQSKITMPYSKFTDWVTVKAAPGQTPHLRSLSIGSLNIPYSGSPSKSINFSQKGNCNLYMSFEGLVIDSGVTIFGSRYVKIKDCTINRLGDLNGSVVNMDNKCGIEIQNGRYITIENNDITHVSIGIAAASYDLVIKNNHIHHNSHDGIRIWGGDGWLIEGNRIHDLDDGVYDDSKFDWNRHVDGIQIWPLFADTKNLTIRGNIFYHIEAMGIMTQTETAAENWTFENNIFGPVGGTLFHLGTDVYKSCIIRHNTVVYAPNDEWVSIYRTMHGQIYKFALWSVAEVNSGYHVYNNIFTSDVAVPTDYGFAANNIFYNYNGTGACPYEAITGNIADYIATGKIPGTLVSQSEAIDAGSSKYASQLTFDFNSKTRDSKPDIGALEN